MSGLLPFFGFYKLFWMIHSDVRHPPSFSVRERRMDGLLGKKKEDSTTWWMILDLID
jgi:hypothetical protein